MPTKLHLDTHSSSPKFIGLLRLEVFPSCDHVSRDGSFPFTTSMATLSFFHSSKQSHTSHQRKFIMTALGRTLGTNKGLRRPMRNVVISYTRADENTSYLLTAKGDRTRKLPIGVNTIIVHPILPSSTPPSLTRFARPPFYSEKHITRYGWVTVTYDQTILISTPAGLARFAARCAVLGHTVAFSRTEVRALWWQPLRKLSHKCDQHPHQ